jgi:hypothetical protein
VVIRRTITTRTGSPSFTITDRIENEGFEAVAIALLYHVNFGAPFVSPQTEVVVSSAEVLQKGSTEQSPGRPADRSAWSRVPDPAPSHDESVFEHRGIAAPGGKATAIVRPPESTMEARVSWSIHSLPRLFEWVWPERGSWALGIEPANAPLFGVERSAVDQSAPSIAPGEECLTEVTVSFHPRQ